MNRSKHLLIFYLSICLIGTVHAQDNATVRLPGIPFPCFWENTPKSFSAAGNALTITSGKNTDMFRDPNATYNTDNAPKVMFYPDSNFVLSASIKHIFANKWDGGAIVLKASNTEWIKFCFEKDYTGAKRVVSVVTKDISDDCNSVSMSDNVAYFKLARSGKVITLYCSPDGKAWLLVRHLQFESNSVPAVGFLAQSPTAESCEVTFANIRYEAKTIRDPYVGE